MAWPTQQSRGKLNASKTEKKHKLSDTIMALQLGGLNIVTLKKKFGSTDTIST